MPVLIECLHPAIAGLDGELAPEALGLEHLLPVFGAVDFAILNVEAASANRLVTLHTEEAVHVEGVFNGVNHLPNNGVSALATARGQVLLIVLLTVEVGLLLHESDAHQLHPALRVGAHEVAGAPGLLQRSDERTSDGHPTSVTDGDTAASSSRHALGLTGTSKLHLPGSCGNPRGPCAA